MPSFPSILRKIYQKEKRLFRTEFAVEYARWMLVSWICYKVFLFRCMENCTLFASSLVLLGLLGACFVVGLFLELPRGNEDFSVFINQSVAYGVYTSLSYYRINGEFIRPVLAASGAAAFAAAVLILFRRVKNKENRNRIIRRRVVRAAGTAQIVLGLGLALVTVVLEVAAATGWAVMRAKHGALLLSLDRQTMYDNQDTLLLLEEESWEKFTVKRKLDLLQTVADIERDELGLANELNVGAANLTGDTDGYYRDATHEIIIDFDVLLNKTSQELVEVVCHEAYHCYEYRMAEVYDNADLKNRNLKGIRLGGIYARELNNYKDGKEDFDSYYLQICEMDARDYGESEAEDYFAFIESCRETSEKNPE